MRAHFLLRYFSIYTYRYRMRGDSLLRLIFHFMLELSALGQNPLIQSPFELHGRIVLAEVTPLENVVLARCTMEYFTPKKS